MSSPHIVHTHNFHVEYGLEDSCELSQTPEEGDSYCSGCS